MTNITNSKKIDNTQIAEWISTYDQQGVHRTGTSVDEKSATWLVSQINKMGFKAELQAFTFEQVIPSTCCIIVDGSTIPATPLYDCSYTNPEGIEGVLEELATNQNIGFEFAPPSENTPEQQRILEARKKGTHKAIIVITPENMPSSGAALVNAEHYNKPFGPPVLQVANRYWPTLSKATGSAIKLYASAERIQTKAFNVCATVPAISAQGEANKLPPVVVMTPRSGWWQCASERGGGIAAFLTIMARLKMHPPNRDVVFTANTGHELGHIGLDAFLSQYPNLTKQAHCWIHLGANFAAKNGTIILQHSDHWIEAISNRSLTASALTPDLTIEQGRRPFGEARNIFDGGGRYLSILGSNPLFHHPEDRWPHAVDLERTIQWSNWISDCVVELTQ